MKTFPMFLKMKNRRVLIIGGGEQAAQKARLILKTEAKICILADHLNSELELLKTEGHITHFTGPLTIDLLKSSILTFSATGCSGAGAAHAALAEQANSIINVVDMPEFCEAMTPSIVDRDPFIIAIGTEGNAPILGRQMKSKIETFLEPGLGRLVSFAGAMRTDVAQYIEEKQRRPFWNWVFNGTPRQEFGKGNERRAFEIIRKQIQSNGINTYKNGHTVMIEVLDSNPDNLRLKDLKSLQEADLIHFKSGFHEDILELARRDALRQAYTHLENILNTLKEPNINEYNEGKNIVVLCSKPLGSLSKPNLKVISTA
ncbi:hypothetical protein F9L33_15275 [Amylibacter sp. SFDW26]|uniref:precorrin-2 dehydrogenase/sirohydrochlorin ferrochelatase family protein n=1 Tax=Amylibacter sp. SFDW26 TaxID=2652722 RepID=UPI0012625CEF|nr:NAD(P)-dependent oxidoreductase [Amylibacter sp. SFDW26]KAB7610067.1 hypothetical protein F9L33_15275 [Amylibacter sp. SFDW26]